MASYEGTFWSYRGGLFGAGGRVALPLWELPGPVPKSLEVFSGDAADGYTEHSFSGQSLIVLVQVWEKAAVFQLFDGAAYQDEKEIRPEVDLGSWLRRYAAYKLRIRNRDAGQTAKYQVVAFR